MLMKRIFAFLLAAAVLLLSSGCGKNDFALLEENIPEDTVAYEKDVPDKPS